ncbi:hypothetical protein [Citrobacter arsenatis]|uniref:hypothetical protein n=1 Tax=Citrobacter arsenatis TaxID=2546350 RepID=UPI00300E2A8A
MKASIWRITVMTLTLTITLQSPGTHAYTWVPDATITTTTIDDNLTFKQESTNLGCDDRKYKEACSNVTMAYLDVTFSNSLSYFKSDSIDAVAYWYTPDRRLHETPAECRVGTPTSLFCPVTKPTADAMFFTIQPDHENRNWERNFHIGLPGWVSDRDEFLKRGLTTYVRTATATVTYTERTNTGRSWPGRLATTINRTYTTTAVPTITIEAPASIHLPPCGVNKSCEGRIIPRVVANLANQPVRLQAHFANLQPGETALVNGLQTHIGNMTTNTAGIATLDLDVAVTSNTPGPRAYNLLISADMT